MKTIIAIFFLFLFMKDSVAQNDTIFFCKKNNIFIEILGAGGEDAPVTFNYDRLLTMNKLINVSFRIGGNLPLKQNAYFNSFPIMLNSIIGKKRASAELGIGWVLIYEGLDYKTNYGLITTTLGFRYQNPKGFFTRIGLTPTIGFIGKSIYASIVGASLGYSF